jgi:Tfp pilus assembly protein PilX
MNKQGLGKDERGLVSILVTMIIMLIISLIVIGFARLSQREQRQALDRQLSTQAFYAAEAGVNDAVEALRTNPALEKTSCGGTLSATTGSNVINSQSGVSYTCVLVDSTPASLEYASIDTDQGTVVPVQPRSGSLERVTVSWQDKSGGTSFTGCLDPSAGQYVFPAAANWPNTCSAGVLRLDIAAINLPATRDQLANAARTLFLYPQNGSSSPSSYNLSSGQNGDVIPVNCNASATPRSCNLTITVNAAANSTYYLRARSIYRASNMSLVAYTTGNSAAVELINAQAVIDSTGKANDVLRRISVRVPLTNIGANVPDFAVLTNDSFCKRFSIAPNINPRAESGDPACQID